MPTLQLARAVRLEFGPHSLAHHDLSGAAADGQWLWVVGDEAAGVERLCRLPPQGDERLRYGQARSFALADVLDLPGAADDEADLEGLAVADGWLWLTGSHGLKRKNAKADRDGAANARRLGKLVLDGNRRLLARVPIDTGEDGTPQLVRCARDGRRAQRLHGDAEHNALTRLLARDALLAPFLAIPGKDNGLDIEGLALLPGAPAGAQRLLLGLRGPVLRGWTLMLELALGSDGHWLRLVPLDGDGTLLRQHVLPLGGLGLRDLHLAGDDLYLLAGPTMVLDGDIRLWRWQGAARVLTPEAAAAPGASSSAKSAAWADPASAPPAAVCFHQGLSLALELPHTPGHDRAEAFAELPSHDGQRHWLVLYDAPGPSRDAGHGVVYGDLLVGGGT